MQTWRYAINRILRWNFWHIWATSIFFVYWCPPRLPTPTHPPCTDPLRLQFFSLCKGTVYLILLMPPFVILFSEVVFYVLVLSFARPHELTFTWWGCCGLCFWHKPTELAHSFSFCFYVCFCLYGSFSCISFHKFSRQLSAFSHCSSGLNSALLDLSTLIISLYERLPQTWYNPL